jgi:hypothetical protein
MAAADGQRTGPTRLQRYVHHLDHVAGEGRLESIDWPSTQPGLEPVTVIPYEGSPEPDMLTAFTYGVSLSPDQDGEEARVELTISVRSDDLRWGWAVGYLAEQMRGSGHFEQGNVVNFHEQPSAESEMTGFLFHHPLSMPWEDYTRIDVGDDLPITLLACIPIHDVERRFLLEHGEDAFWELEWDPYDVRRPPAV